MIRDKDYLRTKDRLMFNVIGYEHDLDRATANLKYVDGAKWTSGYRSAVDFLRKHYPHYVGNRIAVPDSQVAERYRPCSGLRRIFSQENRNSLEQAAVELACECSDFFKIPLAQFGVTDSLLWGSGRAGSDVDLVVCGRDAASTVLGRIRSLYHRPGFERLSIRNATRAHLKTSTMALRRRRFGRGSAVSTSSESHRTISDGFATPSRQFPIDDPEVERLCSRRVNKGIYRGVRFSLRAVREDSEVESPLAYTVAGPIEFTARVVDSSQSLFFPAIYKMDNGQDVVVFLMQYEAAFAPGDELTIRGTLERGVQDRVVVGGLCGEDHRISG